MHSPLHTGQGELTTTHRVRCTHHYTQGKVHSLHTGQDALTTTHRARCTHQYTQGKVHSPLHTGQGALTTTHSMEHFMCTHLMWSQCGTDRLTVTTINKGLKHRELDSHNILLLRFDFTFRPVNTFPHSKSAQRHNQSFSGDRHC